MEDFNDDFEAKTNAEISQMRKSCIINLVNPKIIDGKAIAESIKEELKSKIRSRNAKRKPGLAVILVGDDPASKFYVKRKGDSCKEVGIESFTYILESKTTQEELEDLIGLLNQDRNVDGILLQLPLPEALKPYTQEILDQISPSKDVDGLGTWNLGRLLTKSPQTIYPCTPKGCLELLDRSQIKLEGSKVIVIGRSTLVGLPLSIMLNQRNASVTMAHSRTANLASEIAKADIVISAIGVAQFIKGDWLKPGSVVLDVGINQDGSGHLVGDVDFDSAITRASWITPVPGGIGPMTVAMLLSNTYELWLRHERTA